MDEAELSRLRAKVERSARWSALAQKVFATLMVLCAATAVALMFKLQGKPPSDRMENPAFIFEKAKGEFGMELAQVKAKQADLFESFAKSPPTGNTQYVLVKSDLDALRGRLADLEAAIGSSPEKAIAVPVIKESVEGLNRRLSDQNAAFGREVDRLYNTFILAMTAFVSLIALLCTGLLALIKYGYIEVGLGPKLWNGREKFSDSEA
ncbi:hypothetical protein ABU614_00730 [Lysobacter firmicutimachus]|uniref:Uncharacterized protein n=1 Tax=Lysobacter firmicutimachus TaxID=1792846 RepID=A0AAU8MT26_9GAMM